MVAIFYTVLCTEGSDFGLVLLVWWPIFTLLFVLIPKVLILSVHGAASTVAILYTVVLILTAHVAASMMAIFQTVL